MKDSSGEIPPKGDAEAQSMRRRLMKTIERVYVKGAGERVPDSAEHYAERLFKIVSALRTSNQLYQWPGESEGDTTYEAGQKIRLAFFDNEGNAHVAEEDLELPKYPLTFITSLEAYIAGKPWEEVKQLMAHDPDIADKEVRKIFEVNIDAVRRPADVLTVMRSIGPKIAGKKVREGLVLRLAQRFERMVDTEASRCTTFEELERFRQDIRALVESLKGTDMPTYAARDALDAAALELGKKLYDKAKTYRDVKKVSDAITAFPFAFEEFYKKPLEVKSEDVRAKIRLLYALRHTKDTEGLLTLRKATEDHVFSSTEIADSYKTEILDLLDKKLARKQAK